MKNPTTSTGVFLRDLSRTASSMKDILDACKGREDVRIESDEGWDHVTTWDAERDMQHRSSAPRGWEYGHPLPEGVIGISWITCILEPQGRFGESFILYIQETLSAEEYSAKASPKFKVKLCTQHGYDECAYCGFGPRTNDWHNGECPSCGGN